MVKMEGNYTEFIESGGEQIFIDNLAAGLEIPSSNVEIIEITEGSIVVDYYLIVDDQVDLSLEELKDLQTSTLESGDLELGGDILETTSEIKFVAIPRGDLGDGKFLTFAEDG